MQYKARTLRVEVVGEGGTHLAHARVEAAQSFDQHAEVPAGAVEHDVDLPLGERVLRLLMVTADAAVTLLIAGRSVDLAPNEPLLWWEGFAEPLALPTRVSATNRGPKAAQLTIAVMQGASPRDRPADPAEAAEEPADEGSEDEGSEDEGSEDAEVESEPDATVSSGSG